jgi:hypothetical protein
MNHGPTFTVKRLRLLQFLKERGFTDYQVIPDPTTNKNFNWFLFKNSPELEEAVNDYFNNILPNNK